MEIPSPGAHDDDPLAVFRFAHDGAVSETLNSPVPAGSRDTFFTGLKKVSKERTCAALGITVAVGGDFFTYCNRMNQRTLRLR
jgi:hypothetical protein